MKVNSQNLIMCLAVTALLSGCGGGSGSDKSANTNPESNSGSGPVSGGGSGSGNGTGNGSGNGSGDGDGETTTPPTEDPDTGTSRFTVSFTPLSGSTIGKDKEIYLDFSEAILIDNIVISGSMGEAGELSQLDEDTLILHPRGDWTSSSNYSLTVNATDDSGYDIEALTATYYIDTLSPSITSFEPDITRLEKDDTINVLFSETMDIESLALSGTLVEDDYTINWSKTNIPNDTLTISPVDGWKSAQDRSIQIDIDDLVGIPMITYENSFTVPFYFENFDPAQVVIGQDSFSSTDLGINAKNFAFQPSGDVSIDDEGKLFISDTSSNRVLVFNSIPITNGSPANTVIGKDGLDTLALSNPEQELFGPSDISFDGEHLLISQYRERHISIYDSVVSGAGAAPALTLNIGDYDISPCKSLALWINWGAAVADSKIMVTDAANSRVLIWSQIPENSYASPDLLVGQSGLENCDPNDADQSGISYQLSASTLYDPTDVWSDGEKLAIIDSGNNRILLWNNFPTSSFAPADIVLGQPSFSERNIELPDVDGTEWPVNSKTLNRPETGIWSNGIQLFVADAKNNRVLVWNNWPTSNFAPADTVLGQADFVSFKPNDANQNGISYPDEPESPTASTLKEPTGIFGYKDNLFVTDSGNHRILIFKSR
ncbi:hypothetical protein ACJJIL_12750 [Microbulbifer sp. EKSA005]|uniref:hypothetical protein n=1 Tax=Microbulbifer sp. EKSA005 TaxID=3243364 RepID=UPI0040423489